jgi:hypothetical protein
MGNQILGRRKRLCNARLRKKPGFRCKRLAMRGRARCKLHGSSRGPKSIDEKARSYAARDAGRARWQAEVRRLISSGKLTRSPAGRKSNVESARIARDEILSHPDQATLSHYRRVQAMELEARKLDGKVAHRPEFVPVTPDDVRAAMDRVVALGTPLTLDAIRDELRKAGFMTDQERRAELEKLLAPIWAARVLPTSISVSAPNPPDREASEAETVGAPPPETSPLERERAETEAVARAREQARLQAAYEQAGKIKQAGRNRAWWVPGPAKPIDHAGPHYATPDGRPYGSSRPRRG